MTTLAQGSSVTLTVGDGGSVSVATNGGFGSAVITPTVGSAVTDSFGPGVYRRTYSGFTEGASVVLTNVSCGAFDYDYQRGGGMDPALQALVSTPGNLVRRPDTPPLIAGSVAASCVGGATPWTRLWGPNELRQSPWTASAELTTPSAASKYVTAASASNGPCMSRREGASMWINGGVLTANTGSPTYGNIANSSAGLAAGALANTTICLLVYIHRVGPTQSVRLRLGANGSNYVYYSWTTTSGELVEGWNQLIVHTAEPIGSGNDSPGGQHDFQTGGVLKDGWRVGAGSFTFASAINYAALEVTGMTARTNVWFEGVYYGGRETPRLTIGFDIQTAGLDKASAIMAPLGLVGYAAIPTANGQSATPQMLLNAGDIARLQGLFAAGWDVLTHSQSHNQLGTLADEGVLVNELDGPRQMLMQAGLSAAADMHTTPNNSWSNRLVGVMARLGIKWARHGINAPCLISTGLVGLVNPLAQGSPNCGTTVSGDAADVARFQQWLALLELYGVCGHTYTHAVADTPNLSVLETSTAAFTQMMAALAARVAAGAIRVVTPAAFIRESAPPVMSAVLAAPSRLTLTCGASPFSLINTTYRTVRYVISSGTVSSITYSRDGSTFDSTGQTAGQFDVAPGDQLQITHTGAPTIVQYAL